MAPPCSGTSKVQITGQTCRHGVAMAAHTHTPSHSLSRSPRPAVIDGRTTDSTKPNAQARLGYTVQALLRASRRVLIPGTPRESPDRNVCSVLSAPMATQQQPLTIVTSSSCHCQYGWASLLWTWTCHHVALCSLATTILQVEATCGYLLWLRCLVPSFPPAVEIRES